MEVNGSFAIGFHGASILPLERILQVGSLYPSWILYMLPSQINARAHHPHVRCLWDLLCLLATIFEKLNTAWGSLGPMQPV